MRVQSNGKVRRSEEEWQRILERYRSSGLSMSAFCRREKISKGSFSRWRRRIEAERSVVPTFVELTTPSAPEIPASLSGELELRLPGDIVLRWRA